MTSTADISTARWQSWAAVLKKELRCTRIKARLIESELFQHYSDARRERLVSIDPVDVLGEPRQLASEFNDSFWAGYAVRQLILVPVTAALTLFLGLAVSRCVMAYGLGSWFTIGEPMASVQSEATAICYRTTGSRYCDLSLSSATELSSAQTAVSSWFSAPSPFGVAKTRDATDEWFVVNCGAYTDCLSGERWLLISSRLEKYPAPNIGFQVHRTRAIILALDHTGRLLRSVGLDWKHAENSASLVKLVLQDLTPWIFGAFLLRLSLLMLFELVAMVVQVAHNAASTIWTGLTGRRS